MARVLGRTILPTTEEEKIVLHKLGLDKLRVPRSHNPYQVARIVRRAALPSRDVRYLEELVRKASVVHPEGARAETLEAAEQEAAE